MERAPGPGQRPHRHDHGHQGQHHRRHDQHEAPEEGQHQGEHEQSRQGREQGHLYEHLLTERVLGQWQTPGLDLHSIERGLGADQLVGGIGHRDRRVLVDQCHEDGGPRAVGEQHVSSEQRISGHALEQLTDLCIVGRQRPLDGRPQAHRGLGNDVIPLDEPVVDPGKGLNGIDVAKIAEHPDDDHRTQPEVPLELGVADTHRIVVREHVLGVGVDLEP